MTPTRHGKLHPTTKILSHAAWRRGGRLAARGTRHFGAAEQNFGAEFASPAQAPKRLRGRAPGFAPGRATVSDRSPLSLSSVWDKRTPAGPRARPFLTEHAP